VPLKFQCVQKPVYKAYLAEDLWLYVTQGSVNWDLLVTRDAGEILVQCELPVRNNEPWCSTHYPTLTFSLESLRLRLEPTVTQSDLYSLDFPEWWRTIHNFLEVRIQMGNDGFLNIAEDRVNVPYWAIQTYLLKKGGSFRGALPGMFREALKLTRGVLRNLPRVSAVPAFQRILEDQ
jgi:hypothetical protein